MRVTAARMSSTSRGMMPWLGSSSIRKRGRVISARPIASICCSPPDSVSARCASRSCRRGNSENTRSSGLKRSAPALRICAKPQIVLHRKPREQPASLRHHRNAKPRDPVRGQRAAATGPRTRSCPLRRPGRRSTSAACSCPRRSRRPQRRSRRAAPRATRPAARAVRDRRRRHPQAAA